MASASLQPPQQCLGLLSILQCVVREAGAHAVRQCSYAQLHTLLVGLVPWESPVHCQQDLHALAWQLPCCTRM